jgi:hypothetical protein
VKPNPLYRDGNPLNVPEEIFAKDDRVYVALDMFVGATVYLAGRVLFDEQPPVEAVEFVVEEGPFDGLHIRVERWRVNIDVDAEDDETKKVHDAR